MVRSSLPLGLGTLKKWWESEDKILQCTLPYQRHSGMWNNITKSNLVWALLADSYIPPIVLLKDKAGVDSKGKDIYKYQVEDGQQRLTNLFSFMNDEWELHGSTPEVEVDGTIYDLGGLKYSELSEECQDTIKNYRFSVQCLENYTMEEAESLFYNINSGVALSTVQKSKSKMGTELITFFNEMLSGKFFTQAINITEKQAKSEDDLLLLLQSCLLLDNQYENREYKNISAATCLAYAESIRSSFGEDKKMMVMRIVDYLNQAFEFRCKFLRKNNVPIVFINAGIALEHGFEPQSFKAFINEFANNIYPAYEDASSSGNVKAHKVQMRLRVMYLAMCKYYNINPEEGLLPFSEEISLYLEDETAGTDDMATTDQSGDSDDDEPVGAVEAIVSGDENLELVGDGISAVEAIVSDDENPAEFTETAEIESGGSDDE